MVFATHPSSFGAVGVFSKKGWGDTQYLMQYAEKLGFDIEGWE